MADDGGLGVSPNITTPPRVGEQEGAEIEW